ncbi:MAG: hypothetical protein H6654_11830 [Ardenticatenaceae bacterium]|nr:hypothetical protein [Ardenticatenaceae bacterium]
MMKTQSLFKSNHFLTMQSATLLIAVALFLFGVDHLIFSFKKNSCFLQINQLIALTSNSTMAQCAMDLVSQNPDISSLGIVHGLPQELALPYLYELGKNSNYHSSAYIRIGEILWNDNQKEAAILAWQEAENSVLYITNKSIFEARNNNAESALMWAEVAQQIDPSISEAKSEMYSLLCDSLRADGRANTALNWCLLSSTVQQNGWRQIALANVYYDLEMFTNAVNLLQVELKNSYSEQIQGVLYHKLGQSYFRLGDFPLSESAFRSAIESGFMDGIVYDNLIKSLIRQNKNQAACLVIQTAEKNGILSNLDYKIQFSVDCKWEN